MIQLLASRIEHRYGPVYGQQPRLLIGRDTFHATTIPDICTLPTGPLRLIEIDLEAIDTQPVPVVRKARVRAVREPRNEMQMLWWSLVFLATGFVALWVWDDAVWFLACEAIGAICAGLWMIDMLLCCLFRG